MKSLCPAWCCPLAGSRKKFSAPIALGIRHVILPKANGKDLRDLPEEVRRETEVILAERIGDVLAAALPQS